MISSPCHQDKKANDKGFGGNNASAVVLSPARTEAMLAKRHGPAAMSTYLENRETSLANSKAYLGGADRGCYAPIYRFGEDLITESDVVITDTSVTIRGLANAIDLIQKTPYDDMV